MTPSLGGGGVALIGEALGEDEAALGAPFVGKAGHKLTRLIEWAGFQRKDFDVYNAVWCRPPDNVLEGTPGEVDAVRHCRTQHWDRLLDRAKVLVPMGNVATGAFLGRKGILKLRGYLTGADGHTILPTVHPSFIQRGQSRYSAAFINDLRKAVEAANGGYTPYTYTYTLDPSPSEAYRWATTYRAVREADPSIRLAYDIETPGKGDDEGEVGDDDDPTYRIDRIGFAYREFEGLSIPWAPEYRAAITTLLDSPGEKVVWNAGFDNPRIRAQGVTIGGLIHDGMVAWHVLHSDLPKGLGFVATFTCPWQEAWKHLSGAKPAFYNATDADVELRSMIAIERELIKTNMWGVYQRDVLDLDPILVYMGEVGMPIDAEVRHDRAVKLATMQREIKVKLEALTPLEARKIEHVYTNTPKDCDGLGRRPSRRLLPQCPGCGLARPRKEHFKTYVRKANVCAGLSPIEVEVSVTEYYRLQPFTPSRDQLIRYQRVLNRFIPTKFDKRTKTRKVSMDEKALGELIRRYPEDPYYDLVLDYREADKAAGTYIGRPT